MGSVWTQLVVLVVVSVALAGCSDGNDDAAPGEPDPGEVELASGKGAIQGLLIDDRFRPIISGKLFLQPAGVTVTSNQNGEFSFLDLDPGAYTLKVSTEGHEASPQQLNVEEGEFTEVNVVARRILNEGSRILTQEYSVFSDCSFEAVIVAESGGNCFGDQSGDTKREALFTDYSGLENVTVMVTELKFEQEEDVAIVIGLLTQDIVTTYYAEADLLGGDYIKITNWVGQINEEYGGQRNQNFTLEEEFVTEIYPHGEFYQEMQDAAGFWGAGVDFAVKAQIVQSVFIDEPEVDVEAYCVLC